MRFMAICTTIILVVGYLLGGRLRNLVSLRVEWPALALTGMALQFVSGPGSAVPLVSLYLSFVLLIVFTVKNLGIVGFPLIMAGVLCNVFVIGVNGGMPVSTHALVASDQARFLRALEHDPYPKHHLATADDQLRFLGDVIPVPDPVAQAISLGDILLYAGAGVVVVATMRGAPIRREEQAADEQGVARVGG
jgi:Family of unknown function (DUF5317)